jgi:hypothetical protein
MCRVRTSFWGKVSPQEWHRNAGLKVWLVDGSAGILGHSFEAPPSRGISAELSIMDEVALVSFNPPNHQMNPCERDRRTCQMGPCERDRRTIVISGLVTFLRLTFLRYQAREVARVWARRPSANVLGESCVRSGRIASQSVISNFLSLKLLPWLCVLLGTVLQLRNCVVASPPLMLHFVESPMRSELGGDCRNDAFGV